MYWGIVLTIAHIVTDHIKKINWIKYMYIDTGDVSYTFHKIPYSKYLSETSSEIV